LTIVKKIIEKHNGRVDVESALGQGSTFSFYLPVINLQNDQSQTQSGAFKIPLIASVGAADPGAE
jgi:hypothetical protein